MASLSVEADGSRSGTVSSTSQLILPLSEHPASTQVQQLVDDVVELSTRPIKPLIYKAFITTRHSHSIINRPSKPAWLKDLAVIDMGLYRRFYRQKRRSFAGAGDGAICGAATLATPSSINSHHTEQGLKLQPLHGSAIRLAGTVVIDALRNAAPNPVGSFFSGRHDSARKVALDG